MSFKKLIKQSSNYFWGEALILVSSFISFPILTRILTKHQYGLMSLVVITISILGRIASLGSQFSIVRLYHKYKIQDKIKKFIIIQTEFVLISGMIFYGISFWISGFLANKNLISWDFVVLFRIALLWGFLTNFYNIFISYFRAEEKIKSYNVIGIIRKYSTMLLSVGIVYFYRDLIYFYSAQVFAEFIIVISLFFIVIKNLAGSGKLANKKRIFWDTFNYGFPLAISAIATLIFTLGDRYIIAYLLDTQNVALYSVGSNLCIYLKEVLITSINLSLLPMIFKFWENKQIEQAKKTMESLVRYYFLFACAVVAYFYLVPRELVILVASEKYLDTVTIVPLLMLGVMIGSFSFPFSAGFHLKKDTKTILFITIVMALFNILLNFLLIPKFGLIGAVYATLFSHILFIFSSYLLSRKYFSFQISVIILLKYSFFAVLSYCLGMISSQFVTQNLLLIIILKTIAFLATFFLLLYFFDRQTKNAINYLVSKMKN